jgi:hypothetical protein
MQEAGIWSYTPNEQLGHRIWSPRP